MSGIAERLMDEVERVACPLCEAPPRCPCHTAKGIMAQMPHMARLDVARGRDPESSLSHARFRKAT